LGRAVKAITQQHLKERAEHFHQQVLCMDIFENSKIVLYL
jgi:hypothetical protein